MYGRKWKDIKMSEQQEAKLRSEFMLMWYRNLGKPYAMRRIYKRFLKCISGKSLKKHVLLFLDFVDSIHGTDVLHNVTG